MTTGRLAGTAAVPTATAASSYSTDGWSVSPTSCAQAASARIWVPGRVAPTGVPGLTAKDHDSSGHSMISSTNFTDTVSTSAPRYSVIRSVEVNTTTYGCPSTCSRRQMNPGSPGLMLVDIPSGTGTSTLASSSVDRNWSVCPSLAAASSSASTSLAASKSGSTGSGSGSGSGATAAGRTTSASIGSGRAPVKPGPPTPPGNGSGRGLL